MLVPRSKCGVSFLISFEFETLGSSAVNHNPSFAPRSFLKTKLSFFLSIMLNGSCYCGECAFTVNDQPAGGIFCHCKTCQKLHTHNSYNIQTTSDKFELTKGKPTQFHDEGADCGKPIDRYFCGKCGSALYSIPTSMAGVVFVKVGPLDQAKDIKPIAEIYVESGWEQSLQTNKPIKHFEGMMAKEV